MSLAVGALFAGRYRLLELLGQGAFGMVFAAFDEGLLQRRVALKVLRNRSTDPDQALLPRFQAEVRVTGGLSHPHIGVVHDAGAWLGHLYMVQELIDGLSLDRFLLEHAPLALDFVLELAGQLCNALDFAHEHGIIHRDIKPGNVLIDAAHRLKIVDFGLASSLRFNTAMAGHTPLGTPGYASPEQLRGVPPDARSDLFSAACVIYELATGIPPFEGRNIPERLRRTLLEDPTPPSQLRPDLPSALDRVLARALRKDPAARYPDLRTFARELEQYAAFEALGSSHEALDVLAEAVRLERCVLVIETDEDARPVSTSSIVAGDNPHRSTEPSSPSASDSRAALASLVARAARLPWCLVVVTGDGRGFESTSEYPDRRVYLLTDPRDEPPPGSRPVLSLSGPSSDTPRTFDERWERLDRLAGTSDSLRSILATSTLLFLGFRLEDPLFRHLYTQLTRIRPVGAHGCFLAGEDFSIADVRQAQRKGLRLVERPPLELLAELALEHGPRPAAESAPASLPGRPYKFLNYYDSSDERIFFGREVETQRLVYRILARPLNVLYGASGAGKTSLVRAALIPRLARAGFRAVYVRVFDDPWAEVARAVSLHEGSMPGPAELPGWLAERARAERLLIVFIDQLEELFTRFGRDVRLAFAATVHASLEASQGQLRFVFSLRADHLARLGELNPVLPGMLEHGFYLEALSEAQAREAVLGPARLLGIEVEPALLERLVGDLSREGIDPPQLQLVCDVLFDHIDPADGRLTLRSYQALGEARSILTRHLEQVLEALGEPQRDQARAVLKAMVTSADLKNVSRANEIERRCGLPEEQVRCCLERLSAYRLVRPVEREDGTWYELAHEYLVAEIGRWLSEEDRQLQPVRELLQQSLRSYRQLGVLLSPAQLRLVEAHRRRLELDEEERRFLAACRRASRRSRRRLLAALAVLMGVALGGAVAGRAAWLARSSFIRATERPVKFMRWDRAIEQLESPIDVYRGSPDPWPIDGALGYPRSLYQTDFTLEQVQPARRSAVLAGLGLEPGRAAEAQLAALLSPLEQVRYFLSMGRTDEAMSQLRRLAADPQVSTQDLLTLMPVFGLSERLPDGLVSVALELGGRQVVVQSVKGPDFPHRGELGQPLGLLLQRAPRTAWVPQLRERAQDSTSLRLAVDLLDSIGTVDETDILVTALQSDQEHTSRAALGAIRNVGACPALPVLRTLIDRPGSDIADRTDAVNFLGECGDADDLRRLERTARHFLGSTDYLGSYSEGDTLNLFSAIGRISEPAGIELVERMIQQPLSSHQRWQVLRHLPEYPSLLVPPLLRRHYGTIDRGQWPAEVAASSAYYGDPASVRPLWERVRADLSNPRVMPFLWGMSLYRDPWLRRTFLDQLERARPPTHVYFPLLEALRWYDDDEVIDRLINALVDQDLIIEQAAMDILANLPLDTVQGRLEQRLSDPRARMRINAAQTLERLQHKPREAVFREYLENPASARADLLELKEAVLGLEEAFRLEPPTAALHALSSPNRSVRLAATLVLAERAGEGSVAKGLARAAESPDRWLQVAANRVRWTSSARRQLQEIEAQADQALTMGRPDRTRQLLELLQSANGGYQATLESVLAPQLPGIVSDPDWMLLLHIQALFASRLREPVLWLQAYLPRAMRPGLLAEPRFAKLKDFYAFRVLTGLEPPRSLEKGP